MKTDEYIKLLNLRAYSYDSKSQLILAQYCRAIFDRHNFRTEMDAKTGNLLAVRGSGPLPCIVAHMDINQDEIDSNKIEVIQTGSGWMFGVDKNTGLPVGVGHDDRAGIYFALHLAQSTDRPLKVILTTDEEVGGIGARNIKSAWLKNVTIFIQLDRRGKSDISDHTNGVEVVSSQFKELIKPLLKKHGFTFVRCIFTDIGVIKSHHRVNVCCVNISCGYYDEHTDSERLHWPTYLNSCAFAEAIIDITGRTPQTHKHKEPAPLYRASYYEREDYRYKSRYSYQAIFNDEPDQSKTTGGTNICDACTQPAKIAYTGPDYQICEDCISEYL